MYPSDRLPELADRGVAGLRIEQPRPESAIYDVLACGAPRKLAHGLRPSFTLRPS
jgi:hypothetical protein